MSGRTIEVKCANKSCGKLFHVRVADRNRGWGKFCSKSCKAVKQEARTGQYANYLHGRSVDRKADQCEYGGTPQYDRQGGYIGFTMSPEELSDGGYNNAGPEDGFSDGKF